jgi:hypothetical protein
MSEHSAKPSTADDEIDLSVVFKAIKDFLLSIIKGILGIFNFYYKHKFILLGIVILGAVLGYFYEQNVKKTYTNDLLVIPNYGSADYIYTKVETLNKKLKQEDSLFLKNIFGSNYQQVKSINISPVVDIYSFVSRNQANQSLFELLFEEEGNIEFIENPINSRNFSFHHIYLEIKGPDNHEKHSEAFISYVNNNTYFDEMKRVSLESLKFQLEENKSIIKQIDSIIANTKQKGSVIPESSGFTFTDNSGLNELLSNKKALIEQQRDLQKNMVNQTETIRVVDANYKVLDTEDFLKKDKKKLFPLFFVILYSVIFLIRFISIRAKSLTS